MAAMSLGGAFLLVLLSGPATEASTYSRCRVIRVAIGSRVYGVYICINGDYTMILKGWSWSGLVYTYIYTYTNVGK